MRVVVAVKEWNQMEQAMELERKEMHREVKSLRNERQFCVLRQYLELG